MSLVKAQVFGRRIGRSPVIFSIKLALRYCAAEPAPESKY
jgi:hypothetical protein